VARVLLRDLTARGLSGVALVTSDAHAGLVAAIGAGAAGSGLAAVPHAPRGEPDVRDAQERVGVGESVAAQRL
jgi:hypothetical protein